MIVDEYTSLRSEQIERIKQRDSFVNLAIVSLGIMTSAAFTGDPPHKEILLAMPWVTLAFGWSFILNDVKVARLSAYFATVETDSNGWETWRRSRNLIWLERPLMGALVQGLIFVVPGIAAIFVYFAARLPSPIRPWEFLAAGVGLVLISGLACALAAVTLLRKRMGSVLDMGDPKSTAGTSARRGRRKV